MNTHLIQTDDPAELVRAVRGGASSSRETPNGKHGSARTRSDLEHEITLLWSEVLGRANVPAGASFFESGGTSLLGVRLLALVERRFGTQLHLHELFREPTIQGLVRLITAGGEIAGDTRAQAYRQRVRPVFRYSEFLPLSPAQKRVWFLEQLDPETTHYNIPLHVELVGVLDADHLQRALSEVVRRHEVLRTAFQEVDGEARQVVREARAVAIATERHDLRDLPETERERRMQSIFQTNATRPFDLARPPLLRADLCRLDEDAYRLQLVIHHIACDGLSLGILLDELWSLYDEYSTGHSAPVPELPLQYGDWAIHQLAASTEGGLDREIRYWKQALAGLEPLRLPLDRPLPPVQTYTGVTHAFEIKPETEQALTRFASEHGATTFMAMLAAFQLLLYRYTQQDDIAVSIPVSGRPAPELEHLIGFFINTLIIRGRLRPEQDFTEFLANVRDTVLAAFDHQELPFERLVEELQPPRDRARNPLAQVNFQRLPDPLRAREDGRLKITFPPPTIDTTRFQLEVYMIEGSEDDTRPPRCLFVYNPDLFDATTIERMSANFTLLLDELARDPRRPLSAIPYLHEEERALVLPPGSREGEPVAKESIPEAFARQASFRPVRTALRADGRTVSYGQLDRWSDQLARRLVRTGVAPEEPVAILLPRGAELIVSMLAVLKSGGAYVPLDPEHPDERLAWMLADCGATRIITTPDIARDLPDDLERITPEPARDHNDTTDTSTAPPERIPSGNIAYIIYTSGSTGRPRGVRIPHGNVTELLASTRGWAGFHAGDVWSGLHSAAFDFSVWEIWGALLTGGRLALADRDTARSPERLLDMLIREEVTVLSQTPAAFKALSQLAEAVPRLALRWIIFGGEALDFRGVAHWLTRAPKRGPRLVNMYGITETTVHVTYRLLDQDDAREGRSLIGRPLEHRHLYILTPDGAPAPIGAPGEIYVGGAGLARDYQNRPELTAARFLPDPFSGRPGARMYRTGDRGRRLASGDVEYLGRIDDQIKLRGYRIEPGEIQSALLKHPAAGEAFITTRAHAGERFIVAYVVPSATYSENGRPLADTLRAFARKRLPEYMLPARIVIVERIPLTINGKVDGDALPDPFRTPSAHDRAPQDDGELDDTGRRVVQIWSEVLGRADITPDANFFELGGHSLLAVRLIARLRAEFDRPLPLAYLFESPHPRGLARLISGDEAARTRLPLVPLKTSGRRAPLFLIPPGGGSPLCYLPLARLIDAGRPLYGLQAPGLEAGESPLANIRDTARLYMHALREQQPRGPYAIGGWSAGGFTAHELACQLEADGQVVEYLGIFDTGPRDFYLGSLRSDPLGFLRDAWRPFGRDLSMPGDFTETLKLLEYIGIEVPTGSDGTPGGMLDAVSAVARVYPSIALVFAFNFMACLEHAPSVFQGDLTLYLTDGGAGGDRLRSAWNDFVRGRVHARPAAGNHFSLFLPPHVTGLAAKINADLDA